MEVNRKDRNPERVPGTCEWFTNHTLFQDWKTSPSFKILWVSADPGSGKSVLAKYLIDSVLPTNESRTTCYFFFKDDVKGQNSIVTAMCCILFQLLDRKHHLIPKTIVDRFAKTGQGFTRSFDELWNTFLAAVETDEASEVVVILDALDECKSDESSLLIANLHRLYTYQRSYKLKFLLTSRPTREIRHDFTDLGNSKASFIHLSGESEEEIEKISEEIGIFIGARVQSIGNKLQLTLNEQALLLQKLQDIPNRTYLWVYLVLDLIEKDHGLNTSLSEEVLLDVLSNLPPTVDDAYERILSKSRDSPKARKLVHMVIAAARPLTLDEMEVALKLEAKHQSYLEVRPSSGERFRHDVRDLCGLFVTIVDKKVYLIHQTAKEFLIKQPEYNSKTKFEWKGFFDLQESNQVIFDTCLHYLLLEEFESNPLVPEERAIDYLHKHIFLDYSSDYLIHHFHKSKKVCSDETTARLLQLCDPRSNRFRTWNSVANGIFSSQLDLVNFSYFLNPTPLMITAYFGLAAAVQVLLRTHRYKILNSRMLKKERLEALVLAAERSRYDDGVAQLLKKYQRHRLGIRIPFRKHDIDFRSETGLRYTPLYAAVMSGRTSIVKMVLEAGADANDLGSSRDCPLHCAVKLGKYEIVSLLLDYGADIHKGFKISESRLQATIESRDVAMLRLLFEKGRRSRLYSRGKRRSTLLHAAAESNNIEMVQLLANNVPNAYSKTEQHKALLYAAADCTEAVQGLLDKGANIEAKDHDGLTALYLAVREENTNIVCTLLNNGANTNTQDMNGFTPLLKATVRKHIGIVRLLLQHGADVKASDNLNILGNTSLHHSAQRKDTEITQLLLQYGADVHAQNKSDETPLHHAVKEGGTEIVQLLLQVGADVEARDKSGNTPLHCAAYSGFNEESMLQILLENGADVHARNNRGETALHYAASEGKPSKVQALLDHSADIEAQDNTGRTPLHAACCCRTSDTAHLQLLLMNNSKVDVRDKDGATPLHLAVLEDNHEMIQMLLEYGANIEARTEDGETPLHYAAAPQCSIDDTETTRK